MDKEKIILCVKKAFPKSKLVSFSKLDGGLSNSEIYKIFLNNFQRPFVIKIFPKTYEQRTKKEEAILNYLKDKSIPTVKLLFIDYNLNEEFGFLIEEYVEGSKFYDLIKGGKVDAKISFVVGGVLSKIHQLPKSELWQDKTKKIYNKRDWITSVIERNKSNLRDILDFNIINQKEFDKIKVYFNNLIIELEKSDIFLCPIHGDFNPNNILIDPNGKVGAIFDFEISKIAHNINELGIVYYWYKFYDLEYLFSEILEGYTEHIKSTSDSNKFIEFYYIMQVIGALSFLLKINQDRKAIFRLKFMLSEFLGKLRGE